MSFWVNTILILLVCCGVVGVCLTAGGSDPRKDDYVSELDKYNMRNRGQ